MAYKRPYNKANRRGDRAGFVAIPAFDPDRNRGEIYPDPKDPAPDYSPYGPEPRKADLKPRVIMPAKPLGCECGAADFIQAGPRWVCVNCNPQYKPQPQPTPAREIVNIPASLAGDAAELRKGWELIQAKRAAAGLAALPAISQPETQQPQQPANRYPETVTFFSHMGIAAARRVSKLGGAWRLYELAKALDKKGTGKIARDDLRDYALFLGVEVRTFERWIKAARNNDLFYTDVQSASGQWMIVIANRGIAGAALNCETAGRRVTMPAADLIGKGWKARVWSAYYATHNGQPIARGTMQKIVNVAISTQRYRDAQAGKRVKRIRNYAITNIRGDKLQLLKDFSKRKGLYIDRKGFINFRLPNSYQVLSATRGGKGRGRKVNKIIQNIQATNGLYQMQQALSLQTEYDKNIVKLFNRNHKQQKSAMKKLAKIDNRKVKDIYELSHTAQTGAVMWTHIPV